MSYFERRLNPYKSAMLDLEESHMEELVSRDDYMSLADRLDKIALSEEANKLRSIATDERRHADILKDIWSRIKLLIEE